MIDAYSTLPDGEIVVYEDTDTGAGVDVHLGQENVGSAQRPMRQRLRTSTSNPNFQLNHGLVS